MTRKDWAGDRCRVSQVVQYVSHQHLMTTSLTRRDAVSLLDFVQSLCSVLERAVVCRDARFDGASVGDVVSWRAVKRGSVERREGRWLLGELRKSCEQTVLLRLLSHHRRPKRRGTR